MREAKAREQRRGDKKREEERGREKEQSRRQEGSGGRGEMRIRTLAKTYDNTNNINIHTTNYKN